MAAVMHGLVRKTADGSHRVAAAQSVLLVLEKLYTLQTDFLEARGAIYIGCVTSSTFFPIPQLALD